MPDEFLQERKNMSDKTQELNEKVNQKLKDTKSGYTRFEQLRYANKFMLRELIQTWNKENEFYPDVMNDPDLKSIINEVNSYVALDTTATRSFNMDRMLENGTYADEDVMDQLKESVLGAGYQIEGAVYKSITDRLQKYLERKEAESLEYDPNVEIGSERWKQREHTLSAQYKIAANLMMYFEGQRDGHLEPVPEGAYHIRETKLKPATVSKKMVSKANEPLFQHDPSPTDIRQGNFGDCYMNAALSTLARLKPDEIKKCMRDNGDGTVTVRFFYREMPSEQGDNPKPYDVMKPVYVTVKKEVPADSGNKRSLWVSLIERAYAVSGLKTHQVSKSFVRYQKPLPLNADELYEKYKKMPEDQRPTKAECPWLFNLNDKPMRWQAEYDDVVQGGYPNYFLENLLGDGAELTDYPKKEADINNAKEVIYGHLLRVIEAKTSETYVQYLKDSIRDCDRDTQIKNISDIVVLLHDNRKQFYWQNQVITLDKNGRIENMPKMEESKVLESYCERLEKVLCDEKNANYGKEYKLEEKFDEAFTKVFEKSAGNPVLNQIQNSLKQDKNETIHKFNGEYTEEELKLFNDLRQKAGEGYFINVSTRAIEDENDEKRSVEELYNGVYDRHAYSFVAVHTQKINGKEYKYICVRNPHGKNYSPEYDYTVEPPRVIRMKQSFSEGYCAIELKNFFASFAGIYLNKSIKEEERTKTVDKNILSPQCVSMYNRMFLTYRKDVISKIPSMDDPGLHSKYTAFIHELNVFIITIEKNLGKEMSKVSLEKINKAWESIEVANMNLYGSKEKKLPESMKNIKRLMDLFQDKQLNPKEVLLNKLSGRMLYEDKSFKEIMKATSENELDKGAKVHMDEAAELKKMISDADPAYISSSTEFAKMKKCVKELSDLAKVFKKDRNEDNLNLYYKKINELSTLSQGYLTYKHRQGELKNELEQQRVKVAETIYKYATEKHQNLKLLYGKFLLAKAIYEQTVKPPETSPAERYREICELSDSKLFQEVTKDFTLDKIKEKQTFVDSYKNEMKIRNPQSDAFEYYHVEKRKLAMFMREPKANKEQIKDTAAKMIYFALVKKKNPSSASLHRNEEAWVKKIKTTDGFKEIMKMKMDDTFPNFLERNVVNANYKSIESEMSQKVNQKSNENVKV